MGAVTFRALNRDEFGNALQQARAITDRPVCIVTEVDRRQRVGGYESWWDVGVAEVSDNPAVQDARKNYEIMKQLERHHL